MATDDSGDRPQARDKYRPQRHNDKSWTFPEQPQSAQEQSTRIENTSIANKRTIAFGQVVPGQLDSLAKKSRSICAEKQSCF